MISPHDHSITSDNFKRLSKYTPLHLKLMLAGQMIFDDIRLSDVNAYINEQLAPYDNISDEGKNKKRTTFDHATRALSLAVTLNPLNIGRIITLYPKLLSCVLEKDRVKIKNIETNQYDMQLFDFKLSHLLAREGSCWGVNCVSEFLIHAYEKEEAKERLDLFLSEPMRFSNCSEKTSNGPTPAAIAIIYKKIDFFSSIASPTCLLESKQGVSKPYYNEMNVCYEVLQQTLESESTCLLDLLLKSYDTSFVVNKCFDIIMLKALDGDVSLLNLFLNTPSIQATNFISLAFFRAIDANNLTTVKLLAQHRDKIDEQGNTPLRRAIIKAKDDKQYLPIVQYFISSGYSRCGSYYRFDRETIDDLLEENTKKSFFSKTKPPIKLIQSYVNGLELFHDSVFYYIDNTLYKPGHCSDIKKNPPEKALLNTAKQLDSVFFNQLVVGFLDMKKDTTEKYFDLCRSYFICLYDFICDHDARNYMTSATLEYIADALVDYKKLRSEAPVKEDPPEPKAIELISYFYNEAMNHKTVDAEGYNRILSKLKEHGLKEKREDNLVIKIS